MRLGLFLVIIFSFGFAKANTDLTFKEVDSTSYALYKVEGWGALIQFGERAIDAGYDYYYLNIRMAIGYYNLGNNFKALEFAQRSLLKDPNSSIAHLYAYWAHLNLGEYAQAKTHYNLMGTYYQGLYGFKFFKPVESITTIGALKIPNDGELYGTMKLGVVGLSSRFSANIDMVNNLSIINQTNAWGSYYQPEYYGALSYCLSSGWKTTGYFHYLMLSGDVSSSYETNNVTENPVPFGPQTGKQVITADSSFSYSGVINHVALAGGINVQKRFSSLYLRLGGSYLSYTSTPNYSEQIEATLRNELIDPFGNKIGENNMVNNSETKEDSISTVTQYQVDLGVNFVPLNAQKFNLGMDLYLPFTNGAMKYGVNGNIAYNLNSKLRFQVGYYTSNTPYILQNRGTDLINTGTVLQSQYYINTFIRLSKKVWWNTTINHESYDNDLNYFSIFTGLKINL